MPDQIQIFAVTVDDGNKVFYCTDDIPVTTDILGRVLIRLNASTPGSCSLEPHRTYKAIIATKNQAGGTNSTGDICFCKPVLEARVIICMIQCVCIDRFYL